MKRMLILFSVIICFTADILRAELINNNEISGNISEFFSNFSVNARAAGLGGAYTARRGDVSASYWNPAGISNISFHEATVTDMSLFSGTRYTTAGIAYPFDKDNIFGVSLMRLVSGEAPKTDSLGQSLGYSFREISNCYLITYSRKLSENIHAGANFKSISRELDTYSAQGYGFDLGVLIDYTEDTVYGMSLQNIPSIQVGSDKLDICLKTGLAHEFIKDKMSAYLDITSLELLSGSKIAWAAGAEYSPVESLWLRAGINSGEVAFGFGVEARTISFNYALNLHTIDFVHKLSINFRYGFLPSEQEIRLRKEVKEFIEERKKFDKEKETQEELIDKKMKELKLETWIKIRLDIARGYFKADDFKSAEDAVKQVIKKDPENADAKYLLHEIYRRTKGGYMSSKYAEASDLYSKRSYKTALVEINKVLSLVPDHEAGLILSLLCNAQLHIQEKKYQEAKNELMQVLTLDTEQDEAASLLKRVQGIIELEEGQ